MKLEQLMEKAVDAFAKGKFDKATKLYTEYCKLDPENLQARLRLGDAWARCGNKEKAIAAYRTAAAGFAKEGLLPRAIAANKLILDLDPGDRSVQQLLADLYARRTKEGSDAAQGAVDTRGVVGGSELLAWYGAEPSRQEMQLQPTSHAPAASSAPTSPSDAPAPVAVETPAAPAPPSPKEPRVFDLTDQLPPELQLLEPSEGSHLQTVEGVAVAAALKSEDQAVKPSKESSDPAITRLRGTLPNVPLFSDLEPNPFTELIQRCPLRGFKEGQRVFEQGSRGDAFYIVCSGSVRVAREANGFPQELARLEEGAFFGEMALLSDAPRTATVESTSDETQLLEISADVLKQLSLRYPHLAQALKKFCRQRMLLNVMSSSALFRPFTTAQRKHLIERFRAREVPKNTLLLREGVDSDALYVILSGEVEVRRNNTVVAHLKEGDVFGEMSLLTKSPAVASITSTRRTSLLRLPRTEFDSLIMSHPQILELVAELTDNRRSWLDSLNVPKADGPIMV